MAKKNVNYVDAAKFEQIILDVPGLQVKVQKGFVQVGAAKGRRVYVSATKTVGRVDLSGFSYPGPGVNELGEKSFGHVTQQLDFSLPEPEVLANFRAVLEHMSSLPELVEVRAPRKGKESTAVGWTLLVAETPAHSVSSQPSA